MFFSTELLLKRESGFGLLWLAATIGAKASFKKINKRSILTADIAKLCDMIAEPDEPLALRLSSNLLIGVARVHRAQHEMFYTDVMTCFTMLKKAFVDLQMADNQVQAQMTVRRDQITLGDSNFDMDLDMLDAYWVDAIPRAFTPLPSQDDIIITAAHARPGHPASSQPSDRRRLHLLDESHSFNNSGPSDDPFLEQDDILFGGDFGDLQLDLGLDLGGDFGQEARPEAAHEDGMRVDDFPNGDFHVELNDIVASERAASISTGLQDRNTGEFHPFGSENGARTSASQEPEIGNRALPLASSAGQASQFLVQAFSDTVPQDQDRMEMDEDIVKAAKTTRTRRKHVLWDERIELTNDELKEMRNGYEERMQRETQECLSKKRRYESADAIQALMQNPLLDGECATGSKGIPDLQARREQRSIARRAVGTTREPMTTWWSNLVKTTNDDYASAGRIAIDDGFAVPDVPRKRRKKTSATNLGGAADGERTPQNEDHEMMPPPVDDWGMEMQINDIDWGTTGPLADDQRLRSNEPEQGRQGSQRPSSAGIASQIDGRRPASQRSSLFPWSKAYPETPQPARSQASSHVGAGDFMTSSSIRGRVGRESSVQPGGDTPLVIGRDDNAFAGELPVSMLSFLHAHCFDSDDFVVNDDTQATDMSILTLQRTLETQSLQFLQHLETIADPHTKTISFNQFLDPATTKRNVAATAFYHLLVLSTKDHIRIRQDEAYGNIEVQVV